MKLEDQLSKAREFLTQFSPEDKLGIVYHADTDGVCSAALVMRGIKRVSEEKGHIIRIHEALPSTYDVLDRTFEDLVECNKIIILDIAAYVDLPKGKEVLLIDHHQVRMDVAGGSVTFVNPRLEREDIYRPATYVAYKLMSSMVDMKDDEWIAAMGTIGDVGFEDCMDLLKNWVDVKTKDELYHTRLGKAGDKLLGAAYEIGMPHILEKLLEFKTVEDLENDKVISDSFEVYNTHLEEGILQFWDNVEEHGNLMFAIIKPHYQRLTSPIINRLSFQNKGKALFLLEDKNGRYKISARFQDIDKYDGLHLGEIMNRCGNGGGHRSAAGGMVGPGEVEAFKRCIIETLKDVI